MVKRVHRKTELSPAELTALKAKREKFQRERPTLAKLQGSGEYVEPMTQKEYWDCRKVGVFLRRLREQQGLSLTDVSAKTGIDRAALSRLENSGNPTMKTLFRYAEGVGMELEFEGISGTTVRIRVRRRHRSESAANAST
jgi:hypothetical protein